MEKEKKTMVTLQHISLNRHYKGVNAEANVSFVKVLLIL